MMSDTDEFRFSKRWMDANEEGYENFSRDIAKEFNVSVNLIPHVYLMMYSRLKNTNEFRFWNRDAADEMYKYMQKEVGKSLNDPYLKKSGEFLFHFFETLISSNNSLTFLDKFEGPAGIRTDTLLLPKLSQMINGALTNFCRYAMYIIQVEEDRKYVGSGENGKKETVYLQNRLGSMMDILVKHEFFDAQIVDKDIRNAMSHGGYQVMMDGKNIRFTFTEKHEYKSIFEKTSDVNDNLFQMLDDLNGIIVGILRFLSETRIDINDGDSEDRAFLEFLNRMRLSTSLFSCTYAGESEVSDLMQTEFVTYKEIDENTLFYWSIFSTQEAREIMPQMARYAFRIIKPKAIDTWGQITASSLDEFTRGNIKIEELAGLMNNGEDRNLMVYYPNTDSDESVQLMFNPYNPIYVDGYKVDYITDISVDQAKRFRCSIFINELTNKRNIKEIVYKCVERVKRLPNFPRNRENIKNGIMDAEIVEVSVYLKDKISRKNSILVKSTNNSNYVATGQFVAKGAEAKKLALLDILDWQNLRKQSLKNNYEWIWNKKV